MKEINEDRSWELISKYFGNELNEEEEKELSLWLDADPNNRKELENTRKLWEISDQKEMSAFNTDNGWRKMHYRIRSSSDTRTDSKRKVYMTLYKVAASLLILLAIAYFIGYIVGKQDYIKYTASQRMKDNPIILADGTKVYLNAGAELSYPKKFRSDNRTVKLVGEAFFEVTRNEKQPFIIQTPKAHIQVLGTSFNVLACNNCDSVQVAVKTGIVALSNPKGTKKFNISKGNTGVIFANQNQFKLTTTDINMNSFAWKTGSIIFKDSRLSYVTQTLERIFGEKIILDNEKIKNCAISADFKDEDLTKILESIGTTYGLKINKTNKGYLLTGTQCK
jgi:transmembrane sensor